MNEIFILAHQYGISPLYVEAIPPAERDVLMFFVRREVKEMEEEERREQQNNQMNF